MRLRLLALLLICLPAAAAHAAEPAGLAKARALYNAGSFDAAIDAATPVRQQPQWVDAAALVVARSHLERYRLRNDPADLVAGRALLATIRPALLTPRDQLDLLIGLGQALYLAESFGAAAEIFDNALSRDAALAPRDRLLLLDWWATALEREAQSRAADRRAALFARILARMEEELRAEPGSRAANYWLVAAARGAGDVDRAWDAAIAAWVRAGLSADGAVLRADLDKLVTTALVTERARQRPAREQPDAQAALKAEWDAVKSQWVAK
jgi:hypothetical protein